VNESTSLPGGSTPPTGAAALRIQRSGPRRRRGGWGVWIAGIVLVCIVGAFGWKYLAQATGALGGTAVREGRSERVSPTAKFERTTAGGYVVARTRAAISARQPGKLVSLLVDVGDPVEKGQLLAEMLHEEEDAAVARWEAEVDRARADIASAEATAAERAAAATRAARDLDSVRSALREAAAVRENAELEEKRQEALLAEKIVTTSERDRAVMLARVAREQEGSAKSAVAAAEAEVERAQRDAAAATSRIDPARAGLASAEATLVETRARREDFLIRAPFTGRVLRKEAEVGEVIAPAVSGGGSTRGALLTLADFSTLEMEVDVAERDVALVVEGSPCRIVLDAYPKAPYAGNVRQVVPTADRQKATVQVKVAFTEPDAKVLPEMGGKVVFLDAGTTTSKEADVVQFPVDALTERGGREGVFVIEREGDQERIRFVAVEVGARESVRAVALSGLLGGERVVRTPPASLKDGDRVTLSEGV
jgi:RND family efflux transporter MFP subunit